MAIINKQKSGLATRFLILLHHPLTLIAAITFLAALLLYESMAPVKLSSANFGTDGGDFLAAILTGGVPHPSGYPLYLIISNLAQKYPSGTAVWKQVQLSIIPAALVVALMPALTWISQGREQQARWPAEAALAGICLLAAPLFWSQAVIIEVYALNAFFVVLALLWLNLVQQCGTGTSRAWLAFLGMLAGVCGLGMGNHLTYMIIYPLVAYALAKALQGGVQKTWLIVWGLAWLSGGLTYLALPLRAAGHPPVNWGNPVDLKGLFWLVSGGGYEKLLFSIHLEEYVARSEAWAKLLLQQVGVFGLLAGVLGVFNAPVGRRQKLMTGVVFGSYSLLALGYRTNDSQVYLIPSVIIFILWVTWGIQFYWSKYWGRVSLGVTLAVLVGTNLLVDLPKRYAAVDPRNEDLAHYAEVTLANSPQGETIYPQGDGKTFALWFYHFGLGIRPDVKVISRDLLQYDWYRDGLRHTYPDLDE